MSFLCATSRCDRTIATEAELRTMRSKIAERPAWPRRIHIVDTIPLTTVGRSISRSFAATRLAGYKPGRRRSIGPKRSAGASAGGRATGHDGDGLAATRGQPNDFAGATSLEPLPVRDPGFDALARSQQCLTFECMWKKSRQDIGRETMIQCHFPAGEEQALIFV